METTRRCVSSSENVEHVPLKGNRFLSKKIVLQLIEKCL